METLLLSVPYENDDWYDLLQEVTEGRFESYPTPWVGLELGSAQDCLVAALALAYETMETDPEHVGTLFFKAQEPFAADAARLLHDHGIRARIVEVIGVQADTEVLSRLSDAIAKRSGSGCAILFPLK